LVFAGTPEFAVPVLDALVRGGHRMLAAYTQPDRPAGRGREPRPSAVKRRALALGIAVEQPSTLRTLEARRRLAAFEPDAIIVVAYGLKFGPKVLALPRLGCINVHASLLPRWRGAAPIQRAILAGDQETGVSVMRMVEAMDAGPVFTRVTTAIGPEENSGELQERLAMLGAEALLHALPAIASHAIVPEPQEPGLITHAAKLEKREARVDWQRSATELVRATRAFVPWPVAETAWGEVVLRLHRCRALQEATVAAPGTVLRAGREGIDVATGAGVLRVLRIQAPGGNVLDAAQFVAARELVGARFA